MTKRTIRKAIYRFLIMMALVLSLLSCPVINAFAEEEVPYDTYTYDYWEDIVYTPAAYVPGRVIYGNDLKYGNERIGNFNNPQDICKADNGCVYIADTGNNRIVVLNGELNNVVKVYDSFTNEGIDDFFNAPTGVCVSSKNQLYIADSLNRRIVILDAYDGTFIDIVDNPQSEMLGEGYVFTPLKVSVDYADRIYCVAQNMFEGIMVFESDGVFTGFFGTIDVKISLWEKFWRKLATKEERNKSKLFIPTEFTGIDVDEEGFIYATNIDSEGKHAVRRLNPKGEDVIRAGANGNVGGDIKITGTTEYAGPSQIIDVVYRHNGIYSMLDRKRGRIFTYDAEGSLLYIFGGLGSQAGTFSMPAAIEDINNELVVLDSNRAVITTFKATEYGNLINEATALRYNGNEAESVSKWKKVLMLNENLEIANSGIGKAYLTQGDNVTAMHYFKLAMNKEYYSLAYRRYRNGILKENLKYILTGIVIFIAVLFAVLKLRKPKTEKAKNINLIYTLSHPSDGFYWIRRKDSGNVKLSLLMLFIFAVSFSLNRYLAGFAVNDINYKDVNIVTEFIGIVTLFILVCAANWSVTCLMNGTGRFKDIVIVASYSLLPLNLVIIPATIYSQFVTLDEKAFYLMIIGIGTVWSIVMAVTGVMRIHGYSLAKTLLTLILTIVAIFIIIFLILLLTDLINQVYLFIKSIYLELLFRT